MATIGAILAWLWANSGALSGAVLAILSAAALVARLTPTKKDDKVVAKIQSVVGWLFKMAPSSLPEAPVGRTSEPLIRERAEDTSEVPPTREKSKE